MKKYWLGAALAAAAFADPLTQGERDRLMSHMHATRKQFLDSIGNLSEAQWNHKAGPDRWSIAECAEHIAVSEESLFQLVSEKILKGPVDPLKKAAVTDDVVIKGVPDRTTRVQAPEFLKPKKRWATREELVAAFKQSRDRNIAFVQTTQEDLRGHIAAHPVLKELDGYQWLLLVSAHSERHTLQIQEVKSDAAYPKN